jgi:transposase
MQKFGLSPIIEEFSNILLTSNKKRPLDDSCIQEQKLPMQDLFARFEEADVDMHAHKRARVAYVNETQEQALHKLIEIHERAQGPYGMLAKQLARVKYPARQAAYSFTLISAVSKDGVEANQLIEGGVDSSVYEHFIRRLLEHVHKSEKHSNRRVVLLMDNAVIHHNSLVIETALHHNAIVLFNTPYSPQLNPVEMYFKHLKAHIRKVAPSSRYTSLLLTSPIVSTWPWRSSTSSARPSAAPSARCGGGRPPTG